jgi:glycosyltransferase involved in cell wall biosynthesis
MIYFDVTKTAKVRHRSGLARMSGRLREELGGAATACSWVGASARATRGDWFITTELFSEAERPGFAEFLRSGKCRMAAIFADAIPLKHPQITWPQSVARHPGYMKMLARFDRIWAISQASREELMGYWQWLGLRDTPVVEALPLGADFDGTPRTVTRNHGSKTTAGLLCVGILEPRKNQVFLVDVCEQLWSRGLKFDLHIVGRINPHFGQPVVARIKSVQRSYPALHYHEAAGDEVLARLYGKALATVCPTIAEGCGLPLLESLWRGVPCLCSDLPVLQENADGGGCLMTKVGDHAAWADVLQTFLTDAALRTRLTQEAMTRPLPTWAEAAEVLKLGLG